MAEFTTRIWPLCGLMVLALGACGGAGGGLEPSLGAPRSLAAMGTTAEAIMDTYDIAAKDSVTAPPDSGSAILDGQIELTGGATPLLGDLSLVADFANGTTRGLAGNFRSSSAAVAGQLSGSGQIDGFGDVVTLLTPLSGQLDGQQVNVESIVGLRHDGTGYVGMGYGYGDYHTFSAVRER